MHLLTHHQICRLELMIIHPNILHIYLVLAYPHRFLLRSFPLFRLRFFLPLLFLQLCDLLLLRQEIVHVVISRQKVDLVNVRGSILKKALSVTSMNHLRAMTFNTAVQQEHIIHGKPVMGIKDTTGIGRK